jgi:NAD(P)-dependent dehydrogenase (short-subunit alcohol dehydrogenase family)
MGVVAITGATGALGSTTAAALAGHGATVLLLSRRSPRLHELLESLRSTGAEVEALPVDLSVMASVREAAAWIDKEIDHLDALVHTAAVFHRERLETVDGFETMLATNHLGPFLLTNLLRTRLGKGSRVITVTAPSTTPVHLDQLKSPKGFNALTVFGATKAANLMTTFELARRAEARGVCANAFHPGLLRSRLMNQAAPPVRLLTRVISKPPTEAAVVLAGLATSPVYEGTTGVFFKVTGPVQPPESSMNRDAQRALWEDSARLVGLTGGF